MRKVSLLLTVSVLGAGCGASGGGEPTTVVRLQGLEWRAPTSWSIRRLPTDCVGPRVLVTNAGGYSFKRYTEGLARGSCSGVWDLRNAPRDLVLVDLVESRLPVPPPPRGIASGTPLLLLPLVPTSDPASVRGKKLCRCELRAGIVYVHGVRYDVVVVTGHRASSGDRSLAEALVMSIRPGRA